MKNAQPAARGGDWYLPTKTQLRIMREFIKFKQEHGIPPTALDMCAVMGWSSTNAWRSHFRQLLSKGYMKNHPMLARGAFLTESGLEALKKDDTREWLHDE
jgi:LexA DNA binding domain-containing protein